MLEQNHGREGNSLSGLISPPETIKIRTLIWRVGKKNPGQVSECRIARDLGDLVCYACKTSQRGASGRERFTTDQVTKKGILDGEDQRYLWFREFPTPEQIHTLYPKGRRR